MAQRLVKLAFLDLKGEIGNSVINSVEGADKAMVMKTYRKLYSQSGSSPSSKDLLSEVIKECESILIMKVAIQHNVAQRLVKLAFLDLNHIS